jgi:hypothetical protein
MLQEEVDRMLSIGARNVVLCGPVVDIEGNMKLFAGNCPSYQDLYTMDWDINNTISQGVYSAVPPHFNDNTIDELYLLMSYVALGIFYTLIVTMVFWTFFRSNHPVVKFAQPLFLYIVLIGCLIGITAIIPFGYNRSISDQEAFDLQIQGLEQLSDEQADIACQAIPWLLTSAFGCTFPILIAKTWRLHRLLSFLKTKLSINMKALDKSPGVEYGVAAYLLILFTPMLLWQIYNPVKFTVTVDDVDIYNNPISSTGSCFNESLFQGYSMSLFFVIFLSCICGNVICFLARNDESVNSEITYISLAIMNYLQVGVMAVLVAIVTKNNLLRYCICISADIIAFGGLLFLIFLPKVFAVEFSSGTQEGITITTKRTTDVQYVDEKVVYAGSSSGKNGGSPMRDSSPSGKSYRVPLLS